MVEVGGTVYGIYEQLHLHHVTTGQAVVAAIPFAGPCAVHSLV
jgi:hypothetical protein